MKNTFSEATCDERVAVSEPNFRRISALEPVMLELDAIPRGGGRVNAFRAAAARLAETYHLPNGDALDARAIEAIFYRWRREGWRALMLRYRRGSAETTLPHAFVQFWRTLYLQPGINRSGSAAHRALVQRWRAWRAGDPDAAIPGYAKCPPRAQGDALPAGWSRGNLMRKKYKPTAAECVAVKRGFVAARDCAPCIRKQRPVAPGSAYQFDDVWHDIYVSAPGFSQLVRPLEFGCLDEASASKVLFFCKARLPRKDENAKAKHVQLNGEEMSLLLAAWAAEIGWNRDGCVLKVENGTAAVSAEQEEILRIISRGAVRVERGAMLAGAAYDGAYAGTARGNFRHKANLESHHALLHTYTSLLPGYSGNNRSVPEDTQGMIRERARLFKRLESLPPALRDHISAGELTLAEFQTALGEIVDMINTRTDHALVDWDAHTTREYRIDAADEFRPVSASTNPAILAALGADPDFVRVRKMSPAEVWNAGGNALVRADWREAALLCRPYFKPCTVSPRHEIRFKDPQLGDEHVFVARMRNVLGEKVTLDVGERVSVFFHPWLPDKGILLFNADGTFRGSCAEEIRRIDQTDTDALVRAVGKAESVFRDVVRGASALTTMRRQWRAERLRRNADLVFAHAEQTTAARAASDKASRLALDDADLETFDAPADPPPEIGALDPETAFDDDIPW